MKNFLKALDLVVQTAPPDTQRTGCLVPASAATARVEREAAARAPAAKRENTDGERRRHLKPSRRKYECQQQSTDQREKQPKIAQTGSHALSLTDLARLVNPGRNSLGTY